MSITTPPNTPVMFEGHHIGTLTNVVPGRPRAERVGEYLIPTSDPSEVTLTIDAQWLPLLKVMTEEPGARIVFEAPRG